MRLGAAAAVALMAAGALQAETAAVLPFTNRTSAADPTQASLDWIGESIAETVRDAIGARGVVTLSRLEVDEAYRLLSLRRAGALTQASMLKIGEALDAERVVYGSIEFMPDPSAAHGVAEGSLKIAARVFDRRRFRQSAEFTETGNLEDLATLEAHLAWRTLALIAPKLAPPEAEFHALRPAVRLDAEENYVRGLLARAPEQRERYFLQAARLDARFGHPDYELGKLHYERKEYRQAADWLQKIAPEDFHYRDANFLLGLALYQSAISPGRRKPFRRSRRDSAERGLQRSGRRPRAARNLPQAIDSLSARLWTGTPNDPVYHFNLGYALWKKGDFGAAADRVPRGARPRSRTIEMATLLLGMCLKKQGAPRPRCPRLDTLERLKFELRRARVPAIESLLGPTTMRVYSHASLARIRG